MTQFQLYYKKTYIGLITQESESKKVVRGFIDYNELDPLIPLENHVKTFINKVIEMTGTEIKHMEAKIPRDQSESAKDKFLKEWAPYKEFTDRTYWSVCDSQGKSYKTSTPMFEPSNKVILCILTDK